MNHLWLRHFGKPLVANVFEFGRKGSPPSHPELLDWLAVELMEHNWSFKHLHRLIVTSNAYRMSSSSAGAEANAKLDSENKYLWRMNSIRMEAQVVRDSLLHLAGDLDLTRGGPPVPITEQENSRRRACTFSIRTTNTTSCSTSSTTPTCWSATGAARASSHNRPFALWNSRFALTLGGKINDALHLRPAIDDSKFTTAAFGTILCTTPTKAELAVCLDTLTELRTALKDMKEPERTKRARLQLIQALINHNDFVTVR